VLIDWFTVAAQVVNFLILVALLKHFLYDRIIQAMDEREGKVRARLDEAEKREQERREEAETYRRKNREIEERRKDMLDKAKQAAEDERKELTQNARHEVETLRAKWREGLEREKASFLRELKQMAGRQVFDVSRRALKDLADADMEERVITVFLKEIKAMKREARDKMARTIKEDGSRITVRSAFEISSTQRQQITRTLHEQLAGKADVNYEADPEIIFGVELKSGGEKVTWSLGEYLKALEDQTRMALEKETGEGAAEAAETGPAEQKSDGEDTDRRASAEVETKAETERIEQKPEEEAREKSPETEKKKSPKSKGKKKRRKKRK
jgi:F-type H+-transporting ATPase subunit b